MKKRNPVLYILLALAVLLPSLGWFFSYRWYQQKIEELKRPSFIIVGKENTIFPYYGNKHGEERSDKVSFIIISKENMNLSLIDSSGKVLKKYGIACGKNYGNKKVMGDMKTPEGIFHIVSIEKADTWSHDFQDGKGEIKGAYGPWFLRLATPGSRGIGIHGTHKPESIGTRATEGCIRLKNEDIEEVKKLVHPGMVVVITPSTQDAIADAPSSKD